MRLFIDQYGQRFYANTIKQLKTENYLRGKISKMYVDKKDGSTKHIGYVIGDHWLTEFQRVEREA